MSTKHINHLGGCALLLACSALVSACGGGDAAEGGPTQLSVVPSELTVTWSNTGGACGNAFAGRVFVYGGAGPYRLDNTSPERVQLSKARVSKPGDSFDVTFLGGCVDPATIIVVDNTNRTIELTLRNVAESAAPPASAPSR
jgi:hypothetical protein